MDVCGIEARELLILCALVLAACSEHLSDNDAALQGKPEGEVVVDGGSVVRS